MCWPDARAASRSEATFVADWSWTNPDSADSVNATSFVERTQPFLAGSPSASRGIAGGFSRTFHGTWEAIRWMINQDPAAKCTAASSFRSTPVAGVRLIDLLRCIDMETRARGRPSMTFNVVSCRRGSCPISSIRACRLPRGETDGGLHRHARENPERNPPIISGGSGRLRRMRRTSSGTSASSTSRELIIGGRRPPGPDRGAAADGDVDFCRRPT